MARSRTGPGAKSLRHKPFLLFAESREPLRFDAERRPAEADITAREDRPGNPWGTIRTNRTLRAEV